jgi:simple sugar transport system ATP-binding protein
MKLELRGITKRFGALTANDHIDLTVEPGEIHSLLGENGAGKSTLMNVLYGLYQADEGDILLDDVVQHFGGPGDAMAAGIGMVHQHFMLIPVFTVAENVMLGHEQTSFGGRLDLASARQRVREISDRFGFDVNPDAIVEDLPVGVQQRVEIIKALSRDAKVLVFDEPTAVLTPQETDELMATMRQLRDAGTSIVFITHKLREVRAVADRITVVRLGKIVGTASPTATNEELASLMVGRAVELTVRKDAPKLGAEALVVQNLTVTDETGQVTVDDVSFTVRGGETLAIVGVQGNGQTELTEALVGLQDRVSGSVSLDGNELIGRSVRDILEAGVGFVPEDRSVDGLVKEFSIAENLMLDRSHSAPFVAGGTVQRRALDEFAREKITEFDIRTQGPQQAAGRRSGGTQPKVVLARELSRELSLFVAAQPTRGVDVGSIEFIHTRIVATRDSGIPVIVISTELDEATALADRIMVMYRGKVVGIVPGDTPRETLGLMMAGMIDETASEVAE